MGQAHAWQLAKVLQHGQGHRHERLAELVALAFFHEVNGGALDLLQAVAIAASPC